MSLAQSETVLSLWRGAIAVRRGPTMAQVAAEVAQRRGISVAELCGSSKKRRHAGPRQEAMAEIRNRLGKSYSQIGRFFHRHHTTVVYACRRSVPSSRNVPVGTGKSAHLTGREGQVESGA